MIKHYVTLFFSLFLGCYAIAQTVGLTQTNSNTTSGYILFAPLNSTTTYLIDRCGHEVHQWPGAYKPGQAVYLLEDGHLLRTGNNNNLNFSAGGKGGIIQKIDWMGNVVWTYTLSDTIHCQHHDIHPMPNGNVLIISWERKTKADAVAAGRDSALTPAVLWSEAIFEIAPTGNSGGNVVWEWHLWDHVVQNTDPLKPNYGTVSNHPELVNINYNASATNSDWIHLNAIDYHDGYNQILLSAHGMGEIWVIDHSTTTAQSAAHSGGHGGHGGDILYRWGNPQVYQQGNASDRKLFGQHHAHWIDSGYPYANQIMIFNNGQGRTGGNYSTVEIIQPPYSGNQYNNTLPYLPSNSSWTYNAGNPNNFYAQNISGAQQLPNGHVLVCNGPSGTFFEIDSSGQTIWNYVNPVNTTGILNQGAAPVQNLVFRCAYYPASYSGLASHQLVPGSTIENNNVLSDSCSVVAGVAAISNSFGLRMWPSPADEQLSLSLSPSTSTGALHIYNSLGQSIATLTMDDNFNSTIKTVSWPEGVYHWVATTGQGQCSGHLVIRHHQ
ncbi:MAG: aryl-sulfate sulfotransferase [Chitinophagales bacterium]